jgi:hypothetical protein
MANIEIRITKSELLEQMKVRDFWADVAFEEGYEVARAYSLDDIEVEEVVEVQTSLDAPPYWPIGDLARGLRQAVLIPSPEVGDEWQAAVICGMRQAA